MRAFNHEIIHFAKTNHRLDQGRLFGVYRHDTLRHKIILGVTGVGKTTTIECMALQEINTAMGSVVVVDPNGDLIQSILEKYPEHRLKDLIVIDPTDPISYGFNIIKSVSADKKHLLVSGIMEIFQKMYGSAWGHRIAYILTHAVSTIIDQKKGSLADIPKILVDEQYRCYCVQHTHDQQSKHFWQNEFPKYRGDVLLPILSKFHLFLSHPAVKQTLVEPWKNISFRKALDSKKVILINLSKGKLGADISSYIGSFLIHAISLATFSRADTLEWNRPYTAVYLDEFQEFVSPSIIGFFAQMRKYKVAMTVATQYLSSLRPEIRDSVLGNVSSILAYRCSLDDARYLEKYFLPHIRAEHLISLPKYNLALILAINGTPSTPFFATSIRYQDLFQYRKNM